MKKEFVKMMTSILENIDKTDIGIKVKSEAILYMLGLTYKHNKEMGLDYSDAEIRMYLADIFTTEKIVMGKSPSTNIDSLISNYYSNTVLEFRNEEEKFREFGFEFLINLLPIDNIKNSEVYRALLRKFMVYDIMTYISNVEDHIDDVEGYESITNLVGVKLDWVDIESIITETILASEEDAFTIKDFRDYYSEIVTRLVIMNNKSTILPMTEEVANCITKLPIGTSGLLDISKLLAVWNKENEDILIKDRLYSEELLSNNKTEEFIKHFFENK